MTITEFDNYRFGAGITAKYKGKEYTVISIYDKFNHEIYHGGTFVYNDVSEHLGEGDASSKLNGGDE